MSTIKVGILMVALTALFAFVGKLLGGTGGMVIAVLLAVAMNFGSYWFSDKIVLKMTRAQPILPEESPKLYNMTKQLAERAGLPMPRLYLVNDPSPNAFATGRNPANGVVAVNTGLLNLLDEREVAGVIAHELAHIKHRDTLTMAIVASLAGAIMILADIARFAAIFGGRSNDDDNGGVIGWLVALIVAPLAAMMIQMAVSRAREYEADRMGAEIAGDPSGLANALSKLHSGVQTRPSHVMQPQMSHMCIVNPFKGGGIAALFSTHPPVEERIRRLNAMR